MTAFERVRQRLDAGEVPADLAADVRALLADHASKVARLKKAEADRARMHSALLTRATPTTPPHPPA